ncbi:MAG: hypothetical protein IT561_10665, partial [Alphaproteobacteria bacterium]|nr:hypothetical protein [Alphaproteobacteria bacterium]
MPDGRDRDAATPPVEAAAATDRSSAAESAFAAVKAERFLTDREAILVVTRDLGANGTALLALNLCAFLKRRHNVVLLALAGGPLMEAARQAATVVVALAQATGGRDGALRASMLAAARTFEPSYAIVNGIPDAPLLQGLVHGGTPPVLLLHDRPADETLAQCLSLASLVITPSPALAKGAEDMGGRIETIPPAASQIRMPISVDVRRAEAWRARRDMRPGGNRRAFVVLVHCPSGDQAGIGKMLRLARALADTPARRHLRLVWHVTDETNRAAMDALLAREGATGTPRVSVGVCSETAPGEVALAFADAVLLLPPYSGVPMAALQALGRGTPVITIGGESWFAEMLRGEAGLAYCAAGDDGLDTVAAVVRHLAEDRSRYLATAAAARSLAEARLGMPGYVAAVHRAATAAAQTWRNERPSVAIRGGDPAIAAYRTLDVPWSTDPVVSIIVPVHGNFAFTYACIRSIVETQPRTPLEVIIVDDCS